jgi:hypothetical protein
VGGGEVDQEGFWDITLLSVCPCHMGAT